MARRIAGKLGDGGGPGTRRGIFPRPRPAAVLGEAEVLEVGEGDAGHERVPVQAGPRAPLEVAEAQLLLELLVRLLADPACLYSGRQGAQRRPERQAAEVVLRAALREVLP
jgi:hypothetical protein